MGMLQQRNHHRDTNLYTILMAVAAGSKTLEVADGDNCRIKKPND